jgi:hypothetical protein
MHLYFRHIHILTIKLEYIKSNWKYTFFTNCYTHPYILDTSTLVTTSFPGHPQIQNPLHHYRSLDQDLASPLRLHPRPGPHPTCCSLPQVPARSSPTPARASSLCSSTDTCCSWAVTSRHWKTMEKLIRHWKALHGDK